MFPEFLDERRWSKTQGRKKRNLLGLAKGENDE
jgi:hypothetical protein